MQFIALLFIIYMSFSKSTNRDGSIVLNPNLQFEIAFKYFEDFQFKTV